MTLVETGNKVIKAGEGVIIKASEGSYAFEKTTTEWTFNGVNKLVVVDENKTVSKTDGDNTNYIFANGTHGLGFYKSSGSGTIAAGKAYLSIPTPAARLSFIDLNGNGTTSIDLPEVEGNNEDAHKDGGVWYNLQGQRVEHPTKGIYIKNGKKVIIK